MDGVPGEFAIAIGAVPPKAGDAVEPRGHYTEWVIFIFSCNFNCRNAWSRFRFKNVVQTRP
jgi:hypothetical protein